MGNQNCSKNALKKQLNNFTCNWCKIRVKLVFEARTRVTRQFSHFDTCFTQPHVYGDIQAAFLCIRSGNCIFIRQAASAKGTAKILLVAQLRKHHKLQTRNSKMQIAQYKFGGALINSTGKQLLQILYARFQKACVLRHKAYYYKTTYYWWVSLLLNRKSTKTVW